MEFAGGNLLSLKRKMGLAPPEPEPAPEAAAETPEAPRRAGWWSRRFGGGE